MAEEKVDVETPPDEAAAIGTNDFVYVLRNPLVLKSGKTITELSTDFNRLKARDLKAIGKQFRAITKEFVVIPWTDDRFQLMTVARLNGLITDDLDELNGFDAVKVMNEAVSFFGGAA